jgi:uncharacterized delta-60 repeat protein
MQTVGFNSSSILRNLCAILLFAAQFVLLSCGYMNISVSSTAEVDITPPTLTSLSNETIPIKSKTWNWSCNDNSGSCTYRHVIDTNPTYTFTNEAFDSTTSASQVSGDGTYYLHLQAKDGAENISESTDVSAILDNTAPAAMVINTPPDPSSTLTLAINVEGADVQSYMYKIGPALTTVCSLVGEYSAEIAAAKPITDTLAFFYDQSLAVCIIGKDTAGNWQPASSTPAYIWRKDTISPFVEFLGVPSATSSIVSLDIDIKGLNVVAYKYKIGASGSIDCSQNTGYSNEFDVSINLTDNIGALADGPIKLCAIGRDELGNWQSNDQASILVWTKSTSSPTGLAYTKPNPTYIVNSAIVPNIPINNNAGPFTYSVSPALGSGLTLNAHTGVITGVPSTITGGTVTYTIMATSAAGTTTAIVNMSVVSLGLTIDSPQEGEVVSSYKILRGACLIGEDLTILTSAGQSTVKSCVNGSYSMAITSSNDFGPKWVKVSQTNTSLIRHVYNENIGINNNYGWAAKSSGANILTRDNTTGKIYVGGEFTVQHWNSNKKSPYFFRLNPDGSLDDSFAPTGTGFNNEVNSIIIDSNRKILVGGKFTSYNGIQAKYLTRLNLDGSLDESFVQSGTGLNGSVSSLALDSSGKILVVGQFYYYDSIAVNFIARLNSDGSIDSSFAQSSSGIAGAYPNVIVRQPNGKILVGGQFDTYNGTLANCLVRLNSDGSIDSGFQTGTGFYRDGFTRHVDAIAVTSDGKVLVGGEFTSYNSTLAKSIIRLNSDGSIDSTFQSGNGFGANTNVLSINIDNSGSIFVGGMFASYNDVTTGRFVKLSSNGLLDRSFLAMTSILNPTVKTASLDSNGKTLVGGKFSVFNNSERNSIALLNFDGSVDNSFAPTFKTLNGKVNAFTLNSNGKIIFGGDFTSYKEQAINHLGVLNVDGSLDSSFTTTGSGFNSSIYAVNVDSIGKYIVAGNFTSFNGGLANRIARLNLDGSIDMSLTTGSGFSGTVYSLSLDSNGKYVTAGNFTFYNGITTNYIARINTDGTLDTSFLTGTGFSSYIYSIAIDSSGKIIAGGNFNTFNGSSTKKIARINTDGSLDASFIVGTGFSSYVNSVAIDSSGRIIVGGNFTSYNGITTNRIARINPDGTLDTSFPMGTGFNGRVDALTLDSNNRIIAKGSFTSYNGTTVVGIARINSDGTLDSDFVTTVGFLGDAGGWATIKIFGDKIFIGGTFLSYNSILTPYLVVLESDGSLANMGAVKINPSLAKLEITNGTIINATGGSAPYTYSILSGAGSINSSSGSFTAPAVEGTTVIQVTDNLGQSSKGYVYTYTPNLAIRPSLINLSLGATWNFSATGGLAPYTYDIIAGGNSTISSSGLFTAPSGSESIGDTIKVRVSDSSGLSAIGTVTIVSDLSVSPAIQTLGGGASLTLLATGGVSPYTFSIVSGVGSVNSVSGVYTASTNSGMAVVRVTDSSGSNKDVYLTVNGSDSTLAITPTSLTLAANNTFTFSASGGSAPYQYSLISGGGTITAAGKYTAPATADSTVIKVTDALANFQTVNIQINSSLSLTSNLTQIGTNSSYTFTATGGVGPFTYSVLSTSGGTIGALSGVYTAPILTGKTSIQVVDQLNNRATYSFDIVESPKLNVSSITLERTKEFQFSARGGNPPYTFSTNNGNIDSISGLYKAPTSTGSAIVTITDTSGQTATASITITLIHLASLGYPLNSYKAIAGSPLLSLIVPTYLGDASVFSISPSLPSGLSFNTTTGVISGSPSAISSNTVYTVTATNVINSVNTSFALEIYASNSFTVDSPGAAETISSYKILRGSCIVGQPLTITTSIDLIAGAATDPCSGGSYAVTLSSSNDFGPRWVTVAQLNSSITHTVYNANTGINNNYGWAGINNEAYVVARDPATGKVYMAGLFITYPKNTNKKIPYLIRLNTDGTLDTSFSQTGTGFDDKIYSLAVDLNGKVVVGGWFNYYDDKPACRIARLNSDGSYDSSFVTNSIGFDNTPLVIVIDSNAKILVGGWFTAYNGVTRNYIARLNNDGSLDTTFNQVGTGLNGVVRAINIDSSGRLFVGGEFTSYNGISRNYISVLDSTGALDTTFVTSGSGLNNFVRSIAFDSNGKIYVGGDFTSYDGILRGRIAGLVTNGSLDTSFVTPGSGFNNTVYSIAFDQTGKLLAGGSFTSFNGVSVNYMAALLTNGSLDPSFVATGVGLNARIKSMLVDTNNKIVIGGFFTSYDESSTDYVARILSTGSLDTSFAPSSRGSSHEIRTINIDNAGRIVVGGRLKAANGITKKYIVRYNANGVLDSSFSPTGTGLNGVLRSIAFDTNNKIIVGGEFTSYNGTTRNRLARLNTDGSLDTGFVTTGTGISDIVYATTHDSNGKVLVGGLFTNYSGTSRKRIARLNADGTLDAGFTQTGTGLSGSVRAIVIDSVGKIIVGGGFTSYNGAARNGIARLNTDGSLDTTFVTSGSGFSGTVYAVALESTGKLIVAGAFTNYNGVTANRIARLNIDGSLDTSFAPTGTGLSDIAYSIAIDSYNRIIVGGIFLTYNTSTVNRIVRLNSDGSMDTSFSTGIGFNDGVYGYSAIKVYANKIYIGGDFNTYNNFYTPFLSVLDFDGSLSQTGMVLNSPYQNILTGGSYEFTTTNNTGVPTYSITSGGGSIDPSTGVFTAPTNSGISLIQVADSLGETATAAIRVTSALAITPASATRHVGEGISFTASGGVSPYHYQIISGGGYMDNSGYFIAPSYPCTSLIRATDLFGNNIDASVTIAP